LKDCAVPVPFHADWLGVRDKAIILLLLDTGLRASELLSITLDNLDIIKGEIQICGKGGKWRTVFFGKTTRRALRAYMDKQQAHIFLNEKGDALTRSGLMAMLKRRAKRAGVKYQSAHSFRRLFAITMLRAGVDVYSLKILMGHESEQVLRRYLKLTQQDTREAHIKGSPVEKLI
jgi:integrase/recombinase XerD